MKKHNHPIDDFFREALKDHQVAPSDEAKKAFLKDVMKEIHAEKKGRNGLILLSVFLALIVAGVLLWGALSDKFTSNPYGESAFIPKNVPVSNQGPGTGNKTGSVAKTQNTSGANMLLKNSLAASHRPSVNQSVLRTSVNRAETLQPSDKQPTQKKEPLQVPGMTGQPSVPAASPLPHANLPAQNDVGSAPAIPDSSSVSVIPGNPVIAHPDSTYTIKREEPGMMPEPGKKRKSADTPLKNSHWIPSIGVYYTPEWMFNTLEGTKFINNFGIEGTFHFGRFSVRTGGGLSVARGTNELIVEYNDFLGAYNKLDSMEFTWSNPAQQFVPKFYMSNQDVWDSLMKLDYAKVVRRYTYLQVPLILGYDFWQSDLISIGVRVGPVLSVLLDSKLVSAPYDPGRKRIISMNDIAPEQVSLNWLVMAGLNTSIRLTGALQFEIEPSARYYFNSVYEKPVNHPKPWSIGVRTAFVIKL